MRRYACLFLSGTNICKTELFNPRNPYDTDLPVISNARELFVFFFFRFFFWFGAKRVDFFLLLLLLLEFLFEMSGRLHTYVIYVKLQY